VVEARQHQNGSGRGSRFMLGSQRSHCRNKTNIGFVESSEGVGRKGRMSSTTERYRAGILDGTEIGRLGGYDFRGTVTAGDGSNKKRGKMGAGYVNLRKQRKRQQRKMGREEEGSSSNRTELAAFVLALRGTPVTKPMLYLCDNQALLKAVTAGAATFLVKVKTHRGEPANEEANIPADRRARLFQAKMFPRNSTTGQTEQFSHGESLARKEVR